MKTSLKLNLNGMYMTRVFITCVVVLGLTACKLGAPTINDKEVDLVFEKALQEANARGGIQSEEVTENPEAVSPSNVMGSRVSLTLFNEPLDSILPLFVSDVSWAKGVDSSIRASVDVENVTIAQALERILQPIGLYYVRTTNGIHIGKQARITFRAFKQPLHIVLNAMLDDSNVSYVVENGAGDHLDELINAQFNQLPLEQALTRLLSPVGLYWRRDGEIYKIFRDREEMFNVNFPLLEQSFDISSSRSASAEGGQTTTTSAGLSREGTRYESKGGVSASSSVSRAYGESANLRNLEDTLKGFLSEDGALVLHREVGTIWVKDHSDVVDRLGEFIRRINQKLTRSVSIRGVITEVELSDSQSYGIDWQVVREKVAFNVANAGSTAIDTALTSFSNAANAAAGLDKINRFASGSGVIGTNLMNKSNGDVIGMFVDALKSYGDVSIVSRPSLSVNNGAVGSLLVGNTISYVAQAYTSSTSSSSITNSIIVKPLQTGLSFYVLPHIISEDEALLYVSPELTTLQNLRTIKNGDNTVEAPSISMKQAQTVISVKNGESVVIGGLLAESNRDNRKGVQGLSSLPLLGNLFRSSQDSKGVSEFSLMMEVSW